VAFQEIGITGSSSITTVAPGIAEALVNTAAGLAAAIPALIGYNHFAARLRRFRGRMEDFVLELINLAERNFTSPEEKSRVLAGRSAPESRHATIRPRAGLEAPCFFRRQERRVAAARGDLGEKEEQCRPRMAR
jgi:hypothetical protein